MLLLGLDEGLEGLDAGGGSGVSVQQQQVLLQVEDPPKLLKYLQQIQTQFMSIICIRAAWILRSITVYWGAVHRVQILLQSFKKVQI